MAAAPNITVNLADLPPVIDLYPDAAGVLGIGRTTAYEMARQGEFPVRIIKIGARYKVATADLRALLGVPS
ncbi:helix-turn-helix domain-containing protein [Blastococcus sp. CT_GayMR20]|uniref:helix-turn-helix domain-containing protein n=1 Tax=Blastococcus sp. CT_GayMR20 TaxID=2559609 RepID=UPI001ADD880B|nr:helix-turn-helix domain-containing protein [Blastococcus sp. CT_GayMR20]